MTDLSFAVILSEKKPGSGNYTAVVSSAGSAWQKVILSSSDFAVSDSASDPVDADHKLDPNQVESVAILDFGAVLFHARRVIDWRQYVRTRML